MRWLTVVSICIASTAAHALPPVTVYPLRAASTAPTAAASGSASDPRATAIAGRLAALRTRLGGQAARRQARVELAALRHRVADLTIHWREEAGTPLRSCPLLCSAPVRHGAAPTSAGARLPAHSSRPPAARRPGRRAGAASAPSATTSADATCVSASTTAAAGLAGRADRPSRCRAATSTPCDGAYVPRRAASPRAGRQCRQAARSRPRRGAGGDARGGQRDRQLIIYAPGDRPPRLAWKLDAVVSRARCAGWSSSTRRRGAIARPRSTDHRGQCRGLGRGRLGERARSTSGARTESFYLVDTSKPMFDPTSRSARPEHDARRHRRARRAQPAADAVRDDVPDAVLRHVDPPTDWTCPTASARRSGCRRSTTTTSSATARTRSTAGGGILAIVRLGAGLSSTPSGTAPHGVRRRRHSPASLDVVAHELTHGVTSTPPTSSTGISPAR